MTASNMNRSRNLWSTEEDNTLRSLVEACGKTLKKNKVDWRFIASYLPGRNNKDCRKRWHYRVSASMNLGPWSQSEDEQLKMGIHIHGTHWSRIAQVVGTRNGDQCFKRWNDVLDPGIDRSPWTREEDRMLLLAIGEYGRAWKQIVDAYFPGRTGLDAKNRHRQLTRKRKRQTKTLIKQPIKTEQRVTLPPFGSPEANFNSISSPLSSPSLSTSSSSPPSSVKISIDTNLGHQHLHLQDQIDGERSLSAPPYSTSSSYCWEIPQEVLFSSPPMPTTSPYSSCSSVSASHYERSLTQMEDMQQQYESGGILMTGVSVQYPYYMSTPHPHDRTIDVQQHLDFLSGSGQQGHEPNQDDLNMRSNMVAHTSYQGHSLLAHHPHHLSQHAHHDHHHQPYTPLDGIVM